MSLDIQKNINLAPFTTFKIGGLAKFFIEIKNKEDLISAINWAKENKKKIIILGGGSNILMNDKEINDLVIRFNNKNIDCNENRIICEAGVTLQQILQIAKKNKLSGLEWSAGIPMATIGGAIRGNAEAFGNKISDILESVEVFDMKKNKFVIFSNQECRFNYRSSYFKENNNYLIWKANLGLNKISEKDIQERILNNLKYRKENNPKLPSAGSIFKNIKLEEIKKNISDSLLEEILDSKVTRLDNIGAGLLIDVAGLKGKSIGGANVSLEHGNFIVNTGKATAEDVVTLISYIKNQIRNKFKIQLKEEIQYLGF